MKAEFLKIAGVKSEAEFYKKFPSEEAFMKKHGKAVKKLMAKRAQVGAMIPNMASPRTNPMPIRTTEETLYDIAALQTGQQTTEEKKAEAMYDTQMAKLKEKQPTLLEQLLSPLGDPNALGDLFSKDKKASVTTEDLEILGTDANDGSGYGDTEIISKGKQGGKISKDKLKKIEGELHKASKMHKSQAERIGKMLRKGGKAKKFEPHMMYDPKTGKGHKANKLEDHLRMEKLGYTHEPPKAQEGDNLIKNLLESKAVKIGAPIVSDIVEIADMFAQQKKALQAGKQSTAVAEIAAQAAETMPEQVERQYVRPEDIANTGEEFFPIYGVGTNVLAKNGGMFSDPGYVPLVNPNKQKAFAQGGVLGSNSYLVPKAAVGFDASQISYGGGGAGNIGMQFGQSLGFTDAGSQVGGKIGGTIGSAFGPIGSAVGSFIGSGIGDLIDRDDRRIADEERKTERANLRLASATLAPAIQANYASHVRNGGKIPSNPSMLDTMAMGGDVKTTWGGKVETVSYNPYAGGESIEFKGNSHDYRDPRTGQTGIGVAYGKDSVANNEAVVEVENEPAQQLRDGGGSENLVVYGDLKIPEEYVPEINDERAKGMKFKNYVSNVLNKDEAKINKKMEKAAEKGLEADNTVFGQLERATADAIVNGGDMKLKSIADKKNILADLQNALNETFDEYGVKGNEFITKNKIVEDPERMMNNMAKSGIEIKPENKGKFTAWAKERGMTVAEAANKVMANPDKYPPGVVKMANFAKNARKFKKGQDGLTLKQLPEEFETEAEAIEAGYVKQPDGTFIKEEEILGEETIDRSAEAMENIPTGQSRQDSGFYGNVSQSDFAELQAANPWYDWENFDPSDEASVKDYQKAFNKRSKEAGSKARIKVDGKFGQQTASARYEEKKEQPKETVTRTAKVNEVTTDETTAAAPQGIVPLGTFVPSAVDYPLDPNQLLAEQYAMATGQVQPVSAQGYSPQLRVPYDISLQAAKNDVIAQSRALERNPALRDNPAALANLQARTYAALNKINAEEFRQNQRMKDTVYSANIDALNKARLVNLGIYDTQADRMAEAASKTRTQNIDILSSISSKYAQKKRENMLERIYQNMYPSYAYDKDGNLIQVRGASFNIPGQGVVGGFPAVGGATGTVQNILAGAQAASELFKRKRGPISEAVQPIRFKDARLDFKPDMQKMISESMPKYPGEFGGLGQPGRYSEGLTEYTPGPFSIGNQYSFSSTPQQRETMYFESLKPELPVGNVTAQLMQDPTFLSQQPSENWWEQEPQGKKGKTIKKNNKNSNILRALRNL